MNNEKMKQVLADQWEEGIHCVTLSIFFMVHGLMKKFLATNPGAREKKYVDDWLSWKLSTPESKGKIIPGFNG